MIIDKILDRKDLEAAIAAEGCTIEEYQEWYESLTESEQDMQDTPYDTRDFYNYVHEEWSAIGVGADILTAMDGGSEEDVKRALCKYILENDYNPQICDYINQVEWLKGCE